MYRDPNLNSIFQKFVFIFSSSINEDIQILLKFWAMMHSDRKYIKTSMLTETDPYTQENNQHGGSFIVSNTYFEGMKKGKN